MSPNDTPPEQGTEIAGFELEQFDIYSNYMLSTSVEILFVLRSLIKRGCMATVYFDHGKSFFLTWVLALGKDEKSLVLDMGSDEAVNRKALTANRLIVTSNLDNVKIQFALTGLQEASFEGKPAFLAALPQALLRLQRREYFRLETPLTTPVRCEIPVSGEGSAATTLTLVLLDISGGGLSLMAPTDVASAFKTGTLFSNCRLQIPNESVIAINLCVRNAFPVMNRGGQEYYRVGCEYVNLSGARLNMIQRYITQVERQRKARTNGLD
ncbi:MAG: hypothetical protein H6R10_1396 [Rhodocyclaceae bacterium]|nr:hypothetical protein [Rhodocyclaceae bacterium]